MEIWKDVPDYEGLYQVSNLGRVKSFFYNKESILKGVIDGNGYLKVNLCKNSKAKNCNIHKLVASAFLINKTKNTKLVVDHIDNNRFNNKLENLQLITQRENLSKDVKNKTSKYTGVCFYCYNKNMQKKWKATIKINGKVKHLGYFIDEYKASLAYKKALREENKKTAN
jgi:hypothetical protein